MNIQKTSQLRDDISSRPWYRREAEPLAAQWGIALFDLLFASPEPLCLFFRIFVACFVSFLALALFS